MKPFLLSLNTLFVSLTLFSQPDLSLWKDVKEGQPLPALERVIIPGEFRALHLNEGVLEEILQAAPAESPQAVAGSHVTIALPRPDGTTAQFRIWQSPVMAPGLARNFPSISTFSGQGVEDRAELLRLDVTPQGLHAMALSPTGTWFIDPYHRHNTGYYISYYRRDFHPDREFECLVEGAPVEAGLEKSSGPNPVGEELRTYRLALAATGEYTQFHGGTVENALAAMATIMHRVNGVYEREISARMVLVDSNHLLVFTDPDTDPYTGGSGSRLNQNQTTVTGIIGTAGFDIGHVFDVSSGGVAFLGSVCSSQNKARGYTGLNPPVGDPFAIDYVAHEMGHQFAGNHTFNGNAGSCSGGNRNGSTAFEPGSGTTIMAYAGICGDQNIAPNSDDHFHTGSFDEMGVFTTQGNGNGCAEITPTGNTPPVVDAGPGGYVIPISTPFELEGSATDAEGDSLTYAWEQFDLGPAGAPGSPQGNAPLFRSFSPRPVPHRVFPRIQNIINNTSTIGELLPAYNRNLNFRLTVRDNHPMGGGVDWDQISMTVTDQAGPFRVLSQNEAATWTAGAYETVEWDVAGTNVSPVNAANVNIYLSADGGFTYPILLAENAANDGHHQVLVPDTLQGDAFRVKVKGAGNVFFDINDKNLSIQPAEEPGFSVGIGQNLQTVCAPAEAVFDLAFAPLLAFEDTLLIYALELPAGLTATFDQDTIVLPAFVQLTVSGTENLPTGLYAIQVVAGSAIFADTFQLEVQVYAGAPDQIDLLFPLEGQSDVSTLTTFSWEDHPDATSYSLQVAADEGFSIILFSEEGLTGTSYTIAGELPDSTAFFWRMRGFNPVCGFGPYTQGISFTTETIRCHSFYPEDLPLSFNNFPFIFSRIYIEQDIPIRDVNVKHIRGEYFPTDDLRFFLRSAEGLQVELIPNTCPTGDAFDISIDDEAPAGNIPCPYTDGGTYRPVQPLSSFNGQNANGQWRLYIYDNGTQGMLENWELELCFPAHLVTSSREAVSNRATMDIFPNPASGATQVRFSLDEHEEVHLRVVNLAGQVLQTVSPGVLPAGIHLVELNLHGLPAGLYFVQRIDRQNGVVESGKVAVGRE